MNSDARMPKMDSNMITTKPRAIFRFKIPLLAMHVESLYFGPHL